MHIQLTTIFGNLTFSVLRFDDPKLKGNPLQFFMRAGLVQLGNATKGLANLADGTKQARMDNYWGSVWSQVQLCNYAISMRPGQTLRGGCKLFTTWEEHPASFTCLPLQCVQEKWIGLLTESVWYPNLCKMQLVLHLWSIFAGWPHLTPEIMVPVESFCGL